MSFTKLSEIINISNERSIPFWEVILESDMQECNVSRESSLKNMEYMLDTIKEADDSYDA